MTTQLGTAVIGALTIVVAAAFKDDETAFWTACEVQHATIRIEVATSTGLREQVRAALEFLDQNAGAVPVLPALLLARPGDAALRTAIGSASPEALTAVSEARFELEQLIGQALNSGEATALHQSLDRIDALSAAVTAYKTIHDALHLLQPHLSLMRRAALDPTRWIELKIYSDIFRRQLGSIDTAAKRLVDNGFTRTLDFRDAFVGEIDALATAVAAAVEYDIKDAVSALAASVERGLDSIDVSMRNTVEDAHQPFQTALQFFQPLAASAAGSRFEPLIVSYLAFAEQVSDELRRAITEHTRWQYLDRQFNLLQRTVVENAPGAPGEIDTLWRLTARALNDVCGTAPTPPWAVAIVDLVGLAAADLKPPVSPPVPDAARDRVSSLISSGRDRFTAVDQSLLDWLAQSVGRRPQLISLLRGEVKA